MSFIPVRDRNRRGTRTTEDEPKRVSRRVGGRVQPSAEVVHVATTNLEVLFPTNLPSETTACRGRSHRQSIVLVCLAGEFFGAADVAHGGLWGRVGGGMLDDEEGGLVDGHVGAHGVADRMRAYWFGYARGADILFHDVLDRAGRQGLVLAN